MVDAGIALGDKDGYTSIMDFVLDNYTGNDPQFYIDIASEYNKNKLTEEYYIVLYKGYDKTSSADIKKYLSNGKIVGNASELMKQMLQVQGLFLAEEPEGGCKYKLEGEDFKYYYYANSNKIDFCAYYSGSNQLFIKDSGYMWEFTITYSDAKGLNFYTSGSSLETKDLLDITVNVNDNGSCSLTSSFSGPTLNFDADGKLTSIDTGYQRTIKYPVMSSADYEQYINMSNQALQLLGIQMTDIINTDFLKYYLTVFSAE